MSNRAVGLTWERSLAKGSDLLVLLTIADGCKDNGRNFWGSNLYLAYKCRMTDRAIRYIQRRMLDGGELMAEVNVELIIPDGSRGYIPDRFLHIRCIAEWDAYREENFSALQAREAADPERKRFPTAPAKISGTPGKSTSRGRKNHADPAETFVQNDIALRSDLLVELSVDPLVGTSAAGPARRAREIPTQAQLEKLVHSLLEFETFTSIADLSDAVKCRCADAGFVDDPAPIIKAIDSALVQKGFGAGRGLSVRRTW